MDWGPELLPAEPLPDGAGFTVEPAWKERLRYAEGEREFLFDAAWGSGPARVFLPEPALWDRVVPPWLRRRRDVVAERLRRHSGHELVDTDEGYPEVVARGNDLD